MFSPKNFHRLLLSIALMLTVGCQPAAPVPPESPSPDPAGPGAESPMDEAAAGEQPAESEAGEVTVQIRSWEEVQQMVADRKGKVVVIDIWSTWCVPCMREFPHLVQLQQSFPDSVTCISVAANYAGLKDEPPESFRDEVLEFLKKQKAALTNVICSTPDETLYETLQAASVPIVLVYGTDGSLQKMFTNDDQQYGDEGFTYQQHIVPLVEQLVKQ